MKPHQEPPRRSWLPAWAAAFHVLVSAAPLVATSMMSPGTAANVFTAYPIVLGIVAHLPAAYGILRGRLWLFLAMPAGWWASFAVSSWFARQLYVPPAGPYPIGNLGEALLLLVIWIAAGLLDLGLAIFLALAAYKGLYGRGPQRWTITLRELLVGVALFGVAAGVDMGIVASIKAAREQ